MSKSKLRKKKQMSAQSKYASLVAARGRGGFGRGRGRGVPPIDAMQNALLPPDVVRRKSMDESMDLIRTEVAIIKKIHHINVVKLYDVLNDANGDSLYMG